MVSYSVLLRVVRLSVSWSRTNCSWVCVYRSFLSTSALYCLSIFCRSSSRLKVLKLVVKVLCKVSSLECEEDRAAVCCSCSLRCFCSERVKLTKECSCVCSASLAFSLSLSSTSFFARSFLSSCSALFNCSLFSSSSVCVSSVIAIEKDSKNV